VNPEQCRAARDLLGWRRLWLAFRAGVSSNNVERFELGHRQSRGRTVGRLGAALEAAGVEFTDGDVSHPMEE
jgi:transcriptional regulator with XRE-family HTH domain